MVDKKLSQFDEVSTGDVSYFPVLDGNTKNAKISGTKAMPWTNCITDIPQDIKLSLNNGTLTLLAGSKVYIPNGSGVFDVLNIQSDKTVNCSSTTGKTLIRIYPDQQPYGDTLVSSFYSGSDPSGITGMFYNTTTNKITYHQNGVSDGNICSLPIAEITVNNGQVTSIDKIFNGFGYIGRTVFALPGVKGLIPDGRNADGSLKNIEFTTTSVSTTTFIGTSDTTVFIKQNGSIGEGNSFFYDSVKNFTYYTPTSTGPEYACDFGKMRITSGVVSNFNPKPTFHAVEYSEFRAAKDDMVTLSTVQTISGKKAFGTQTFHYSNVFLKGDITLGSSSDVWGLQLQFQDTNGSRIGRIQPYAVNTSENFIGMWVNNATGTREEGIYVYSNGNTSAPTPQSVTDNSQKIVTTQWFNNKIKVVSALPANPVNGVFYFITD